MFQKRTIEEVQKEIEAIKVDPKNHTPLNDPWLLTLDARKRIDQLRIEIAMLKMKKHQGE